jgi:hypothetical protein
MRFSRKLRRSEPLDEIYGTWNRIEYVAIPELFKEICFIYFLLKGMVVDVHIPIIVRCNNVGATFMAENSSSRIRTRHIDTRYHFVREHVKDGLIKVVVVKSRINDSDMFMKMCERKHMKNMSTSF